MICVYRAALPTNAHLVQHWLRRNGIPAEVRGDLMLARGELPIVESAPSVWVAKVHEAQARELVDEFEQPEAEATRWDCPRCGEDNEPNFHSCWNCSADRAAALPG